MEVMGIEIEMGTEESKPVEFDVNTIPNYLYSCEFLCRTPETMFFRIPGAFQRNSGGCCCGGPDCHGKWDTLAVPVINQCDDETLHKWTYTVHVGDIRKFVQYCQREMEKAARKGGK